MMYDTSILSKECTPMKKDIRYCRYYVTLSSKELIKPLECHWLNEWWAGLTKQDVAMVCLNEKMLRRIKKNDYYKNQRIIIIYNSVLARASSCWSNHLTLKSFNISSIWDLGRSMNFSTRSPSMNPAIGFVLCSWKNALYL